MDINELLEGIMTAINQYTDDIVGERMQAKNMGTRTCTREWNKKFRKFRIRKETG
jgi:hypothetical protein